MESKHHQASLSEPLLLPTTCSPVESDDDGRIKTIITFSSDIVFRFACIILIGIISLWANYEASKGFSISIINDAGESFAGKRFSHFYVSDDRATRIVFYTSKFVENILYPSDHRQNDHFLKKQVNHVILRLANQNMSADISVESRADDEYVLHLNPSIMKQTNFKQAIVAAIQRGMVRIWLWDGQGTVPQSLTNDLVEYISRGFETELINPTKYSPKTNTVEEMLVNCGKQNPGFVPQLNQAMRNRWQDSIGDYLVDVKTHANFCNLEFHD